MAEQKPSAVARPKQGVRRSDTRSGVIHVRTHQSGQYVVIGNHLAQHRQLSLTAIGLATHILSLPEGALVDIRTLAGRFPEGRERIASGLRELEDHGYLERVRERSETGHLVTRTYAHHTPERAVSPAVRRRAVTVVRDQGSAARSPDGAQEPSQEGDQSRAPHRPPTRCSQPVVEAVRAVGPVAAAVVDVAERDDPPSATRSAGGRAVADRRHDQAVALLAGLRRTDDRLTLASRDVDSLAPLIIRWFEGGATAAAVHHTLTSGLPEEMRCAARVLAYRLRELMPPPLPTAPVPSAGSGASGGSTGRPDPFQTCDGCERAFRSPQPGRCRDCRPVSASARGVARAA